MVMSTRQHSGKAAAQQGAEAAIPEPSKIGACTPYDFHSKNLTAYGGLLPVATMLEKLEFQRLLEETLTVKRTTRSMTMYQFVLAMVLALYVGFSRLNHLRFLEREPMLVGILKVLRLPPQCTFWRFLASLHLQTHGGHAGHRYHRAHAVRAPDGSAQGLQPKEQREEELSADSDVSGRDPGIHRRRTS